jgi:glycosyltransferase involved in cell wall biosynthesis
MHENSATSTAVGPEPVDRHPGRRPFGWRWPLQEPLAEAMRRRLCCIVPCYNVGKLCAPVIADCVRHAVRVIAVDDGSTDDTPAFLRQAAERAAGTVDVLTLSRNRGKGVALIQAFHRALAATDCEVIVTLDGDGQHRAGDIPRLAAPALEDKADLVIAQRQFPPEMPARSRFGNNLSYGVLSAAYRHSPRDTQCGLRAHRRSLVEEMTHLLVGNRYDTEARILMLCLREHKRIAQIPIPAIYHGKNESSHYRPLPDSLRILAAFCTIVALPELGIPVNANGLFAQRLTSTAREFL